MKGLTGRSRCAGLRTLLAWIASTILAAQPLIADQSAADSRKQALQTLKEGQFDNIGEFEKAATAAKKAGVPAVTVEEAKLIYCFRTDSADALPDVISQLEKMLPEWKESSSLYFRDRSELEALILAAKAVVAEQAHDEAAFERFMKEAFWKFPDGAKIFGDKVSAHREKIRLASLTLPMQLKLPTSEGDMTSLAKLVAGHKAVLLDFWASWCGPCMSLMDELRARAEKLKGLGVVVAGVNTEGQEDLSDAKQKAERVRKEKKMSLPWLIEPADAPLSKLLRIDTIPRAVLVSPEGKVLFNGHPSDPALIAALAKLGVQLAATE
jgi:thiol-disulfide isomerase/thioredoxin